MRTLRNCLHCNKTPEDISQFWTLNNYHGISGVLCTDCYALVLHDSNGKPKNPTEYLMILLKQEKING